MMLVRIAAVAALTASLYYSEPAQAGVEVSPVLLNLDARTRVAVLRITNRENRPLQLRAAAKGRGQSDDWSDVLTDTDDLIVNPPISTLMPDKTQVFRIALRRPLPAGPERAYRIIISDVTPPDAAGPRASGISFHLSHFIPLYSTSVSPSAPAIRIDRCEQPDPGTLCAWLRNTGQSHIQVETIAFSSGSQTWRVRRQGAVLAGASVKIAIPRPADLPADSPVSVALTIAGRSAPLVTPLASRPDN